MAIPDPPSEPDVNGRGLDDLQARIDRARGTESHRAEDRAVAAPPTGLGVALRLSTELFAGTAVGGGIGWIFDRTLGTSPFGLIGFIFIGFAAGVTNLIRAAGRGTTPGGPPRPGTGG